jgi:hypothetical protein
LSGMIKQAAIPFNLNAGSTPINVLKIMIIEMK